MLGGGSRRQEAGGRAPRTWLLLALAIGLISGVLCAAVQFNAGSTAGDFTWAWRAANDLLAGRDVYQQAFGDDKVPYPLPAAFAALPFAFLPPQIASGVFFGLSSALLAWCLLRYGAPWWLLLFLSWPFWYNLIYVQWTPLLIGMAFLSPLLPLLLVKPQIALPLLIWHPFSRLGVGLFVAVGLVSLLVYPTWPFVWLSQISGYRGTTPPLLSLPLGPLLLLALLRYRDRRAWFLLLMALMPQRVVYDQLALLLVARTRRELLALVVCSWITLPALIVFDGWTDLPAGWPTWIVATLYLPALVVVLRRVPPR